MAATKKHIERTSREKRKFSIRKKLSGTADRPRLSVFRSLKYTYAQVISDVDGAVIAHASSVDQAAKEILAKLANGEDAKGKTQSTKGTLAARALGVLVAQRCQAKGISSVVFDRNGYAYHGRTKAVADGAREGGLKF